MFYDYGGDHINHIAARNNDCPVSNDHYYLVPSGDYVHADDGSICDYDPAASGLDNDATADDNDPPVYYIVNDDGSAVILDYGTLDLYVERDDDNDASHARDG